MNLKTNSGNFDTLNKYLNKYEINKKHFNKNDECLKALKIHREKVLLKSKDMLVENSVCRQKTLREILERESLLKYECGCGNNGLWQNKKLVLQVDHINGKSNDNRIENLRYLCPNCHSQTTTFSGKNKSKI